MNITIKLWDLWVRIEQNVNFYLGRRVRRILQQRELAKAEAFLKKFRDPKHLTWTPGINQPLTEKTCGHLKGGKNRAGYEDYNLAGHTFPDGRTKIWCLYSCGLEAWKGDKNFENLKRMFEQSSNKQSSSEITGYTLKQNADKAKAA